VQPEVYSVSGRHFEPPADLEVKQFAVYKRCFTLQENVNNMSTEEIVNFVQKLFPELYGAVT
jgi:hypothetical protein